jgi:hypothetical protein
LELSDFFLVHFVSFFKFDSLSGFLRFLFLKLGDAADLTLFFEKAVLELLLLLQQSLHLDRFSCFHCLHLLVVLGYHLFLLLLPLFLLLLNELLLLDVLQRFGFCMRLVEVNLFTIFFDLAV